MFQLPFYGLLPGAVPFIFYLGKIHSQLILKFKGSGKILSLFCMCSKLTDFWHLALFKKSNMILKCFLFWLFALHFHQMRYAKNFQFSFIVQFNPKQKKAFVTLKNEDSKTEIFAYISSQERSTNQRKNFRIMFLYSNESHITKNQLVVSTFKKGSKNPSVVYAWSYQLKQSIVTMLCFSLIVFFILFNLYLPLFFYVGIQWPN